MKCQLYFAEPSDVYSSCFEVKLLQCTLHAAEFKFDEAIALLLPALKRFPQHEIGAEFLT